MSSELVVHRIVPEDELIVERKLQVEGDAIINGVIESAIPQGTSPFRIESNTVVPNLNAEMLSSSKKSTDTSLSEESNNNIPTEKAVKAYVDSKISAIENREAGYMKCDGSRTLEGTLSSNQPVVYGRIGQHQGVEWGNQVLDLSVDHIHEFTCVNNIITIPKTGCYYISAQQLIQTNSSPFYLCLQKNGSTLLHGYTPGTSFVDLDVSGIFLLNAHDSIRLYGYLTYVNSWSGAHSYFSLYFLG